LMQRDCGLGFKIQQHMIMVLMNRIQNLRL
jgi:hypothetical protein